MKTVRVVSMFVLSMSVVLLSVPVFASMTGTITDSKGDPVKGAFVKFINESDESIEFSGYTDDSGFYTINLVVGIEENAPEAFKLGQNYPNPFNPTTTIPFKLANECHIRLAIYNSIGQLVRTLIDSQIGSGFHVVIWDGCDESGQSVSAGMYINRLSAGDFSESRKMLLIDSGGNAGHSGVASPVSTYGISVGKTAKRVESITYRVSITGEDIVPYEESGITLIDGDTYDFVVIRRIVIHDITFVTIPSGTFRMGNVENYGQYSNEKPVHSVTLSAFEMSIYEITQGQYQSVMETNPAENRGVGDNYPVYYVSWYDAVRFCNKLSDAAGFERCYDESTWACDFSRNGFRLPTEAEWEYACRAGTETNFYTGNNISSDGLTSTDLDRAGWYWDNWGQMNKKTHVVGEKEPNAFGLYDMHGNVWEWTYDRYGLYTSDDQTNPTGHPSGSGRVERGSSWRFNADWCRSAYRYGFDPSKKAPGLGFRVVHRP